MQSQTEIKHSPNHVVIWLRERAEKSQVFNAMAHVFALRERTRQQITLTNLYQVMLKEGFKYSKSEYGEELQYMASLGIGKLEHDSKGRLRALKGIRVTLQSIGLAAAAKKDSLDRATLIPIFTELPVIKDVIQRTPPKKEKSAFTEEKKDYEVSLTIQSGEKRIDLVKLRDLSANELISLIVELTAKVRGGK